ncbi:MAG: AbrB/MazE/SpoVT family DNA-binding domain-containing protein [Bacillota bacterium]|nr:AbrB/MazE/SpoVT family DNA-binding domain-containing protein [Bacillota bacterium]
MPKVQDQHGSLVTTIPKEVAIILNLQKGDYINFNITGNEEIRIVKIKEEQK